MKEKKTVRAKGETLTARIEQIVRGALIAHGVAAPRQAVETSAKDIMKAILLANEVSSAARSAGSYLRLVRRMLDAIRGGISRGQFLAGVFAEISKDNGIDRAVVVVEGYPDHSGSKVRELAANFVAGSSHHRIENFRKALRNHEGSRFLVDTLFRRQSYDFDLRSSLLVALPGEEEAAYQDELAGLYGVEDAWICALPLPASESGEPERALIALYPVLNPGHTPSLPPGASQEWDVLRLVPDIFLLLQHRVQDLRSQVADDQRKLIQELTSSAIAHELGTSLSLMESALDRSAENLVGLRVSLGDVDDNLMELARELSLVRNRISDARRTTDAFTNLERRNPFSRVRLQTLVEEVEILLRRKLNQSGVRIISNIPEGLEIVTDARYVEHVIMNVVINAIEAIEPLALPQRKSGEILVRRLVAIEATRNNDNVDILIANDGPEIPISISGRIFEKGITTKPFGVGHGQGLHLCRQIATHLGGQFGFGRKPDILSSAKVSFLFSIPENAQYESDT